MQDHLPRWIEENRLSAEKDPRLGVILDRVLEEGGLAICRLGETERGEIPRYLEDGRAWSTRRRVLERMHTSRCHENSAVLYDANRPRLAIVTGFALDGPAEGLWRSHSWCWDIGRRHVVETTHPFTAYWGFRLSERWAETFVDRNGPW